MRTSLWSQRSTSVPAIGLNSRFGTKAAMKTSAEASTEPVVTSTAVASATWWMRSPNSEISWPAHNAENEPLSARRTYGCWRTRATVSGDGRGIAIGGAVDRAVSVSMSALGRGARAGDAMPAPCAPRTSGRSSAAVSYSAGARPVSGATPPRCSVRGRVAEAASPTSRRRTFASSSSSSSVGTRTTLANRKNPRPSDRNRSPRDATFRMNGIGIGKMSPSTRARVRNAADRSSSTTTWMAEFTSAAVKPAASRLGSQIGMWPPLRRMTIALSRMPMNARLRPG